MVRLWLWGFFGSTDRLSTRARDLREPHDPYRQRQAGQKTGLAFRRITQTYGVIPASDRQARPDKEFS